MKVKTIFEVSDGGFSVKRSQLEEADKVVAFSFSEIDQKKTSSGISIIGEFRGRDVESLAAAVAAALVKIAGHYPEPTMLWSLFEDRYRMEMMKHAMDGVERTLKSEGKSQEEIDRFFDEMNQRVEKEGGIAGKK